MKLAVLPYRTAGAAENMATDFLLLQRYPDAGDIRFRSYGWRVPAFTFGYSQKIAAVRAQLATVAPESVSFDLCRRPTGGGIVDHREDWTYALVIPRGHPWEEERATRSYRSVHEAIAGALRRQGVDATLKESPEPVLDAPVTSSAESVCFQRAETYDVVHARTGAKIAGAAQKRNKRGLLFQGSISRAVVGASLAWDEFEAAFVVLLAAALGVVAEPTAWPELDEDEVSGLTEQYASSEWIEHR